MYREFQGLGEKYLINVTLITYVIDKRNIRVIITAFDEIEVIDTMEEIKEKIQSYYRRQSVSIYN
jgi:predicted aspartyl protease